MIIDFTVKNYRSIKDSVTLSMEASGAKGKSDNIAEVTLSNGDTFRLLKTAVIYGANGSGKSNIIRAFWTLRNLISKSFAYDSNDPLTFAEPFELDTETQTKANEFEIHFINHKKVEFWYFIAFNKTDGILEEVLSHKPDKRKESIFKRKGRKIECADATLLPEKLRKDTINPKRLFLSELGNEGDVFWEGIRDYFTLGNSVWNISAPGVARVMTENAKWIFESDNPEVIAVKERINKLVQLSDLGIKEIGLKEEEEIVNTKKNTNEGEETYTGVRKLKRFKTYHNVYENNEIKSVKEFDLYRHGSAGTAALVGLSAEVLLALIIEDGGRPLWVDEMDNSLHPLLCRFIVRLYHHPRSNPHNSQLIFATHEITLLDRGNFRKDQIWITEKDKFGRTTLHSVHDIDLKGLRDGIPFDKWYMSGKFGGIPHVKEMDIIFDRASKQ